MVLKNAVQCKKLFPTTSFTWIVVADIPSSISIKPPHTRKISMTTAFKYKTMMEKLHIYSSEFLITKSIQISLSKVTRDSDLPHCIFPPCQIRNCRSIGSKAIQFQFEYKNLPL